MKVPKGADLLETLIRLYAEQEGLKIEYEIIIEGKDDEKRQETYIRTTENHSAVGA